VKAKNSTPTKLKIEIKFGTVHYVG